MPKQRESKLSHKIMAALREEGVFVFKIHGSTHMMNGLPDLVCCVDGLFVGLETKHLETKDDLSSRQLFIHSKIRQANGVVVVVTSKGEALEVINEIRKYPI